MVRFALPLFFTLLSIQLVSAQGLDLPQDVSLSADFTEFDPKTKEAVLSGNVHIAYQDSSLKADKVWINTSTQDIYASGNVQVEREGDTWRGDYVQGNLRQKSLSFNEHYTIVDDWHISGSGASRMADGRVVVNDATISPCNQLMKLRTGQIIYHPDGRFKAHNVQYRLGGVPVFYLPLIWGDLDNDYRGLEFRAGFESDNGAMLRLAKRWRIAPGLTNKAGIHYYSKRGIGGDNRLNWKTETSNTDFYLWGQEDADPLFDRRAANRKYNGRFEAEDQHYRVRLHHRTDFSERLSLQIHGDIFSDNDVLYDFFETEYRDIPQAPNFADLTYLGDNFSVSLNARKQLNDFYTVVERLPELELRIPRQKLFSTPVLYQGESSGAHLRMKWRDYDLPTRTNQSPENPLTIWEQQMGDDYSTTRFDTMHFLFLPLELGVFNFTPRVGGRLTWYGDTSEASVFNEQLNDNYALDVRRGDPAHSESFTAYDADGGSQTRGAVELGFDLRTKLHGTWNDYQSEFLDINGLRHVVEPFIHHTYIPSPDVDAEHLYFFDEIDRIDETHFTRVGVEQRFQTHRNNRVHTFAKIETYYDFYHETEAEEDASGDLGLILEYMPREDLTVWWQSLLDTSDGELNVAHAGIRYGDENRFFVDVSYLYQDDFRSRYNYSMVSELSQVLTVDYFPIHYDENESLRLSAGVPLNDKTTARAHLFFDVSAGSLVRQRYELLRDLNCWMASLSFEKEEDEIEAFLLFYLKSLPKFGVGFGN